jgi:hypothetical protein
VRIRVFAFPIPRKSRILARNFVATFPGSSGGTLSGEIRRVDLSADFAGAFFEGLCFFVGEEATLEAI